MAKACSDSGRQAADVALLAVSKRQSPEAIKALYSLGLREFGESYAGEGVAKQSTLCDRDIGWHFIGPMQSNKTGLVASHYDWMQSLDRQQIARRLNRQRPAAMAPLNVLIQVNIDAEPHKSGVLPADLDALVELVSELPRLALRGLMTIPRAGKPPEAQRQGFKSMRLLFARLQDLGEHIDTLSMGMSADLEHAIVEGSTMVRVGTGLFGPRQNNPE